MSSFRIKLVSTTLLAGLTAFAAPAAAQDAAPAADETATAAEEEAGTEVVVTGSRIARPNLEANSPIKVVTGEATTARGDITLDTYLNTLPGVNPAGTTTSNNPPNDGQSNIDFRGLGPNRNLVLVDGRRAMVSASDQTVDINTIPQPLIERVDVITGGAGAAYGADAIAGVANFVLKRKFEGLELRASYANSLPRTDAREFQLSGTLGGNFADDRGNLVVSIEHSKRQGLIKSQRPFAAIATSTTSFIPEGLYLPGGNAPTQASVDAYFAQFGAAAGSVAAGGSLIGFNLDGSLFSRGVFNTPANVVNFRYPIDLSVKTDIFPDVYSYNFDAVNILGMPLKRDSVFAKAQYELTDGVEFFAQGNYTTYSAASALAPTPVSTVGGQGVGGTERNLYVSNFITPGQTVGTNLVVPVTNPFIPAAFRNLLATRTGDNPSLIGSGAGEAFFLRQRTLDVGLRQSVFRNKVYQALGGLRGEFAPGWNYELSYAEGKTKIVERQTGNIDTQRLQNLLEAADGGRSLCAGGFNPFGRQPISQECQEYLAVSAAVTTTLRQRVAQAFVTGDLFDMPGGTAKVVLGGEYRKFQYDFDPGSLSGPISGFSSESPAGGVNEFKDLFGEIALPLASDTAWAKSLELSLGFRYSDFASRDTVNGVDGAGSGDWAYKAELSWQPLDWARLRGSFQHSVRAPNFQELFDGAADSPQYFDPCSVTSTARTSGANAAQLRSLCETGNTANAVTRSNIIVAPGFVQTPGTQISTNNLGNPALKPESSNAVTGGIVLSGFDGGLRGFRAAIDYYHIKIKDVIVQPNANLIVANCYNYFGNNPSYSGDNANCRMIRRAGGDILIAGPNFGASEILPVNGGFIQTSGLDFQLGYDVDLPFVGDRSRLSLNLLLNHVFEFRSKELADQPAIDYVGTVAVAGTGLGGSQPAWKGVLDVNLKLDDHVSLNSRTRYIHKAVNRFDRVYRGEQSFTGVPAVWYFDFGGEFAFDNRFTLRMGLNNAFNKQPPTYRPNQQSGTDPSLYDVIGRRFYVQTSVKF